MLRNAAKARTEHLGLSSLDLEVVEAQRNREPSAAVAAGQFSRNLIQRPRETVSSLLGKTAHRNQFKLEALTDEFFEPLEELLDRKSYLFSDDQPSSLDAFVLGYLSLMFVPELPFSWLRNALNTKSPQITRYIERMREKCFGVVSLSDAFGSSTATSQLPWQSPERVTIRKIGSTLINTLADATPVLKDFRRNDRLGESVSQSSDSDFTPEEKQKVSEYAAASQRDLYLSIVSVTAGVTALVGYMFHVGHIMVE
jgi:sorting and assembly machinery component 37